MGIGAVALPGSAALGWWVWLPRAVEEKVVEVASRFGFEAEVEGAHGGWSSIELDHLTLEHEQGIGMELEHVAVAGSPLGLALNGSAAIERIDVAHLRARVDVERGAAEWVRSFRRPIPRSPGVESGGSASRPPVAVQAAELEVRDREAIVRVSGGVSAASDEIRWSGGQVRLGSPEHPWLEADGIEALARRDEGWKVVSASARSAKWSTDRRPDGELGLAKRFVRPREGESTAARDE
ncbi:MAG: hypothetical protein H6723_09325, partial [Sandaracinus sp.]|nr:hypothetical protein [Sandaracinus sp.]